MHGINRRHHHRNVPCPQEKSRYVNLSINANKREKKYDNLISKSYLEKEM